VGTLQFPRADAYWWRKPRVMHGGRATTAELAILDRELETGEQGAWLNSRGTTSGVIELVACTTGEQKSYETRRIRLPPFVSRALEGLYVEAKLTKGCPDLVIWRDVPRCIRLVEVKCPRWDKPSREQEKFMSVAAAAGIRTKLVEWEFEQMGTVL
jgi:hypothetical protein